MDKEEGPKPLKASNLRVREATAYEEFHFTGGIRGGRPNNCSVIFPVVRGGRVDSMQPKARIQIVELGHALGVSLIGVDLTYEDALKTRQWHPYLGTGIRCPSVPWGSIAYNAMESGDEEYARISRNLATCLRAANIRIRDVSDQYHRQLVCALEQNKSDEYPFDNVALPDLHLAFHSLASELASARDHLASLAGIHVNAPQKVDSLASLLAWLKKQGNEDFWSHPFVEPLAIAADKASVDPWLYELSEHRNTVIHRAPMGAQIMEHFVRLKIRNSRFDQLRVLQMPLPAGRNLPAQPDALDCYLVLYRKFLLLAGRLVALANYPDKPPTFKVD